jgi:hypothetical protein
VLIAALVVGSGAAHEAAVAQTRAPDSIVAHAGPWPDAVASAPRDADWVWLLDGGAAPDADCLAELVGVADGRPGLAAPVLLSSRVEGPEGALDAGSAPWPPLHDRAGAMDAAIHRLAAVRLARWGSLLVRADALHGTAPPRAGLAGAEDLEWTGRLLRDGGGYVVPGSRAVRERPRPVGRRGTLKAAATGEAWDTQERLWLVYASLLEGSRPSPSLNARAIVDRLSRLPRLVRR